MPSISPTSAIGMAYPAVAVAQTPMVSPTELPKDDFKREKLSLPKLSIKAGDATALTRTMKRVVAQNHFSTQHVVFFPSCSFGTKRSTLLDKPINNGHLLSLRLGFCGLDSHLWAMRFQCNFPSLKLLCEQSFSTTLCQTKFPPLLFRGMPPL